MANPNPKPNPRWVKGVSGNPAGRPRDTFGPMVREFLDGFELLKDGEKEQRGQLLIKKLFHMGVTEGNVRAIAELLNRGFGLPTQRIDIDLERANELAVEELSRRYNKDKDDLRKRAQQRGMGLVG